MVKIILSILACIIVVNCKTLSEQTPVEPHADPVVVDDVAFFKLGTYRGFTDSGVEYQKSYFLSRYSTAFWAESKAICKAFDLELTSMETLAESRALLLMSESHSFVRTLGTTWFWIDGIALTGKSPTDWYWTKSGKKISFSIPWLPGAPDSTSQFCLLIGKININSNFGFEDGYCNATLRFVCQRVEFFMH